MTCQEFLASNKDEIRIIWAWLDGYYTDEQEAPIIDTDTMVDNLKKLNEYCAANPTIGLITATAVWEVSHCTLERGTMKPFLPIPVIGFLNQERRR